MRTTQAARRDRATPSRVGRRLFLLAVTAMVGFQVLDGLVGDRGFVALMHARRQRAELATQVAAVQARNGRLRLEIDRLRSDPTAIEELARQELGLIKPGERLFIIRDVPAGRP